MQSWQKWVYTYIIVPAASCKVCSRQCAWTKCEYTNTIIWWTQYFYIFHRIVISCCCCRTTKQGRSSKCWRSKHAAVYKNTNSNKTCMTAINEGNQIFLPKWCHIRLWGLHWLIELSPNQHKIGHYIDILPSQSLSTEKLNLTKLRQTCIHNKIYYNTK